MRFFYFFLVMTGIFLFLTGCSNQSSDTSKQPDKKNQPGGLSSSTSSEDFLRSCLGPNYPDAVIFKTDYLKLINPQAAEYELTHSANIYELDIDLDRDGIKEHAVSGLVSLKPEVESEGKYRGFVAIFRKTPDQCQKLFFREMETGEINNMNLMVKENRLMIALAANTGYSILIEYVNGKYQIVEESDESDDETLPDELKTHSLN